LRFYRIADQYFFNIKKYIAEFTLQIVVFYCILKNWTYEICSFVFCQYQDKGNVHKCKDLARIYHKESFSQIEAQAVKL
jgi:hypothetical protein